MYPPGRGSLLAQGIIVLCCTVLPVSIWEGQSFINATFSRLGGVVAVQIICTWRTLFSSQSSRDTALCDV